MSERFLRKQLINGAIERLTSIAEYADASHAPYQADTLIDELRQMLRGEISRLTAIQKDLAEEP
jgi:hypothetical protein